jgi:hypothetical protein
MVTIKECEAAARRAYAENGSLRVFVGMHRPPRLEGGSLTDSGVIWKYGTYENAWRSGHFDVPLYRDAP